LCLDDELDFSTCPSMSRFHKVWHSLTIGDVCIGVLSPLPPFKFGTTKLIGFSFLYLDLHLALSNGSFMLDSSQ
jgi:hypothetical protein